ncbi:MAG TPA: tRNA (N(6)-L-threonylcarbamoyladenosine(37)-C(2))-methylthiotransferase [Methanothermococcus okinawensis]|nr:tRNA (N(6)-L-threonylcarbamoyladenosine(37)-C(2))-methylthiotransferase [Methanothermococcus okinawensis]
MNIYIEGYGCTLNTADTKIIKNSLKLFKDFQIVDNVEDADIVVINTCVVRLETENRMISRIEYFRSLNKKIVVAGCMPKALREKVIDKADLLIMPREAHLSGEMIYRHFKDKGVSRPSNVNINEKLKYLKPEGLIMPLPISEGCVGKCTYCIVKVARGDLLSYDKNLLVKKAREYVDSGVKHILITAQDTACYGFDKGYTLPDLLKDIIFSVEGAYTMRIGMMHAKNVPEIIDDLLDCYRSDKIAKFLHLPLQSGDDKVLKDMKREYTVDEFIDIVKEFKRKVKDLNFNTDIIVGFPTESEENFENTLEVLKKIKPDYIHGAKYTPRRHTLAAKMKQIDTKIRKMRSKILDKLRRELSYENNKKYIGKTLKVLITEKGKGIAHNCKVVKFNWEDGLKVGNFIDVKITDAKTFGLFGEVLRISQ